MFVMMIAVLAAMAAITKVVVFNEPGTQTVKTFNVGKITQLDCIGCLPAASTVTVYRVTGVTTNTMVTAVLTNGAYNVAQTTTPYMLAGDTIICGGAYTSGVVRCIITAD